MSEPLLCAYCDRNFVSWDILGHGLAADDTNICEDCAWAKGWGDFSEPEADYCPGCGRRDC